MYTALLRGINRHRVAASGRSRSPFCLGTAYRCQSSEPEVAEQESEVDKPSSIGDAPLPAGDKLRTARDLGAVLANSSAPSRLPWASLDTVPPNPQVSGNSNRSSSTPPVAVHSRSRPSDASRAVSARLPWDAPRGVQQSSKSELDAAEAPLFVRGDMERVGVAATDPSRAGIPPLPFVTRSVQQSNISRHQNNAAQPEEAQVAVRLPWERMVDGLVSGKRGRSTDASARKEADGIPAGRSQSKLEQLTDDWARSGPPGNEGLGGAASHQQIESTVIKKGPKGWDLEPSRDGRNERTRFSSQPKPTQRAASLPWDNLPRKRLSREPDGEDHRKMMDKMMGTGRYGGSPSAHRGAQGASRKRREIKVVVKEVQIAAVPVSVRDLASAMSKKATEVMKMLRQMGETNVSPKFMVEPDTAELVTLEFGLRTKRLKLRDGDLGRTSVTEESFDSLAPRPAVVSVMGHVDHGKTTLLDALRKSKVAGTESAGITQKIGAFSVDVKDSSVTFFDTPGHAAFKSMRHSTSRLTDIVLVAIAADDGIKSQTVEVLQLLNEFPNIAPVVAVTKIDRYGVDTEKAVDKISRQLLEHNVITEGYGGQVPIVPVSAVTREGFDDLLETLMLQAEILELRADDKVPAEGVVVDSSVVKGKGAVADVLISWGKLKQGDIVVAGLEYGKVRSLTGSNETRLKEAGAAEPVRIVGMKGLPKMGDEFLVVESEARARAITAQRQKQQELEQLEKQAETLGLKRVSEEAIKRLKAEAQQAVRRRETALFNAREAVRTMKSRRDDSSKAAAAAAEEIAAKAMEEAEKAIRKAEMQEEEIDQGPTKCFAIFKAEGFGQLEAMSQVTEEIPQDKVELSLVRTGLGSVTQSDVEAAALAEAPIFAFNVGPLPPDVKAIAQKEGVQIHSHDVIYRFLDGVKAIMSDLLPPEKKETVVGEGKALEVFETSGRNKETVKVAGLTVSSGKLSRDNLFRVVRNEGVLADGLKTSSMRRFKDKVNEVTKDKECGVVLEGFNDFEEGDVVQCYIVDEIKRSF